MQKPAALAAGRNALEPLAGLEEGGFFCDHLGNLPVVDCAFSALVIVG